MTGIIDALARDVAVNAAVEAAEEEEEIRRANAAVKIQAAQRGRAAREALRRDAEDANDSAEREARDSASEDEAAVDAAVKTLVDGAAAAVEAAAATKMTEEAAATKIQAAHRGRVGRAVAANARAARRVAESEDAEKHPVDDDDAAESEPAQESEPASRSVALASSRPSSPDLEPLPEPDDLGEDDDEETFEPEPPAGNARSEIQTDATVPERAEQNAGSTDATVQVAPSFRVPETFSAERGVLAGDDDDGLARRAATDDVDVVSPPVSAVYSPGKARAPSEPRRPGEGRPRRRHKSSVARRLERLGFKRPETDDYSRARGEVNEHDDDREHDREYDDREHDREYDTARVLRLAADAAERRAEIHRAAVARGVFLDDAVEPVDERDVERMSPTGQTSSNANADDFSLGRDVYREREASFGTVDEAEENAATTSYEYRPPARRFRETSRDDFDFGSDARSRLVGVTASELRAKNDELRWRRERREREERALAEERRRFEILKRELEEIEARRREQAAAKEARKVREAELRAVRMENKRLERRVRRERVAFENKARRAARGPAEQPLYLRMERAYRENVEDVEEQERREVLAARRAARNGGVPVAGVVGHVQAAYERRRATEMYPDDARFDRFRDGVVELPAIRSSSSVGADLNPHRVKYGDRYHGGRRGAMLPNLDEPRKSRFQRLREEKDREARLRLPLEAREKVHRRRRAKMYGEMVKELHRPRVSERARREVATRADAIRPGFEDLSRIAPPEPASRAADEYDINGRRVARDPVDAPRREHFRPAPPSKQMPASGGGFRSGQRARARAEKQLRARRDDDAHYDGYDGVVGYDGYDGYGRYDGYDRAGVSEDASFYPPAMDDVYDDPRVALADSPESDGYVGAGEFAGEVGGVTVGRRAPRESEHLAPRESEHLAPRESEHLAASLGGKGFRTALRERQLAAVEARRAANADDGIPRVNAYQAVDDTPCVGAQTFSATKGLVGLEDVEGGFDAAAGGDVAAWDADDDAPRGMGEEDEKGEDEEKPSEKEEKAAKEDDEEKDDDEEGDDDEEEDGDDDEEEDGDDDDEEDGGDDDDDEEEDDDDDADDDDDEGDDSEDDDDEDED